jgi:hypothetical protein
MRYFFHLEDGACIRDPKGVDFPNDATALIEAANIAQELSREHQLHADKWRAVPLDPALAVHPEGIPVPPRSIH